jgi:hypothetical protein
MLLRDSLVEVFDLLKAADLTVKYRPDLNHVGAAGTDYASKFNSGIIGIGASDAGLEFARHYARLISDFRASGSPIAIYRPEYRINMVIDQELLYVAYQDLASMLKFVPLPDRFNDARFDKDSLVWHGKGTARKHPLYVVERARYQNDMLYYPGLLLTSSLILGRSVRKALQSWRELGS